MYYASSRIITVVLLSSRLIPLASNAATSLTLIQNGVPAATIVISADACQKTLTAANELQHYLQAISSATLPIATDDQDVSGPLILVGRGQLADQIDVNIPSGLTHTRREEGFVISCDGGRLLLAGNNDGHIMELNTRYMIFLNGWVFVGTCLVILVRLCRNNQRSNSPKSIFIKHLIL